MRPPRWLKKKTAALSVMRDRCSVQPVEIDLTTLRIRLTFDNRETTACRQPTTTPGDVNSTQLIYATQNTHP